MKIEVNTILVGNRVLNDFGDKPWEHYLFQCTVKTESGSYEFEFRCGTACAESKYDKYGKPKKLSVKIEGEKYTMLGDFRVRHPNKADILYSLAFDADSGRMSHFDFCSQLCGR